MNSSIEAARDAQTDMDSFRAGSARHHILFLLPPIAAALVVRQGALQCSFLADDFLCMDYLHKIFHGEPWLFLQRMVSPWQNPHIQLLYRPLADVFLTFDYTLWRSNAYGYHLTNLLLHCGSVAALYASMFQAVKHATGKPGRVPAMAASTLFAVNPLYTEAVVWIAGRMDLLCTCFLLAALASYLKALQSDKRSIRFRGALLLHLLALVSKEMAVVLPAILVATNIFIVEQQQRCRLVTFLRQAFCNTGMFWLSSGLFMIWRTAVLGHFPGGYIGSYGEALSETMLSRLSQPSSIERILQPLHSGLFPADTIEAAVMHALFAVAGLLLLMRIPFLPWQNNTLRIIVWSAACCLLSFIPTLQIYQITNFLGGGRLFYLPGAFAAMTVVACIFPLEGAKRLADPFKWAAITILAVTSLLYARISDSMIGIWQEAGEILCGLRREITAIARTLPPDERMILLNLPGEHLGAYLMFSSQEMKVLVGPEFCQPDLSTRLVFPDIYPVLSPLSCQRLQRLIQAGNRPYWYDPHSRRLLRLNAGDKASKCYSQRTDCNGLQESATKSVLQQRRRLSIRRLETGTADTTQYLVIAPSAGMFDGDQLEASVSYTGRNSCSPLLRWSDADAPRERTDSTKVWSTTIFPDGQTRNCTASLADIVQCPPQGGSVRVLLSLPEPSAHELRSVDLVPGRHAVKIAPDPATIRESADGSCVLTAGGETVNIDASGVPEAAAVLIELSRPDVMFNFSRIRTERLERSRRPGRQEVIKALKFSYKLPTAGLVKGRYQLRACALQADGSVTGMFSEPLTFLSGCAE